MSLSTVTVSAPCRLHFGLLSFGNVQGRRYGGVGVMVSRPGLRLQIEDDERLLCEGPLQSRVHQFVKAWVSWRPERRSPRCRIRIVTAPRQHIGLGTGTQLGLAVAAGLNSFYGHDETSACRLAESVGRGRRSAVGTHGFLCGGLIHERGKLESDRLSPLSQRIALPKDWRFVLLLPRHHVGLSGTSESNAFARAGTVSTNMTESLLHELHDHLLPAAKARDFEAFSDSVYRYGYNAGKCFANESENPFASDVLACHIARMRAWGIRGVGQSSWGPTLFGLFESEGAATRFIAEYSDLRQARELEFVITPVNNEGARISGSVATKSITQV